jgi:hypothetical protein
MDFNFCGFSKLTGKSASTFLSVGIPNLKGFLHKSFSFCSQLIHQLPPTWFDNSQDEKPNHHPYFFFPLSSQIHTEAGPAFAGPRLCGIQSFIPPSLGQPLDLSLGPLLGAYRPPPAKPIWRKLELPGAEPSAQGGQASPAYLHQASRRVHRV